MRWEKMSFCNILDLSYFVLNNFIIIFSSSIFPLISITWILPGGQEKLLKYHRIQFHRKKKSLSQRKKKTETHINPLRIITHIFPPSEEIHRSSHARSAISRVYPSTYLKGKTNRGGRYPPLCSSSIRIVATTL